MMSRELISKCRMQILRLAGVCLLGLAGLLSAQVRAQDDVIVRVNRTPITAAELRFDFFLRQIAEEDRQARRQDVAEQLVDRFLIEKFLERRKVIAPEDQVEQQVQLIKRLAELRGTEYEKMLTEAGLTESQLRKTLALPLAWKIHVEQTVSQQQILEYFKAHRRELDGTRLTGAQIVKVVSAKGPEEEWAAAEAHLKSVRAEIASGKVTFADAAKSHSDSPSASEGGDLGKFEYTGRLPVDITSRAFSLKPGEMSEVFRTQFGVHLLLVSSEIPGQLSAEDVRPQILEALGKRRWDEQVKVERSRARIEWPDGQP